MFLTSPTLLSRIHAIAAQISAATNGAITFEEHIALPHIGWIILRFNLHHSPLTLSDIDHYESLLYSIVGNDFLIDFMGNVYQSLGIDYSRMDELFHHCHQLYHNELIPPSVYADQLRHDVQSLLSQCQLDPTLPVWEIQPDQELQLLLYGQTNAYLSTHAINSTTIHVYTADSIACHGLTCATFYAKRSGISLAHALLHAQQTLS